MLLLVVSVACSDPLGRPASPLSPPSPTAAAIFNHVCAKDSNRSCNVRVEWQHPRHRGHWKWFRGAEAPKMTWSGTQRIPKLISQTGPPQKRGWHQAFRDSYGSWQVHHPSWTYRFWNDSRTHESNPDLEPFVAEHFPFFLPAWKRLCYPIMRYDVARYMWLYKHGGVYSDLDIEALTNLEATSVLKGATLVLPGDDMLHDRDMCPRVPGVSPPPATNGTHMVTCAPHIGNYWMAAVPAHPLWLLMLSYVSDNVDAICQRRIPTKDVLELTGPLGLGRVVAIFKKSYNRVASVLGPEHSWQDIRFIDRVSFFREWKYACQCWVVFGPAGHKSACQALPHSHQHCP